MLESVKYDSAVQQIAGAASRAEFDLEALLTLCKGRRRMAADLIEASVQSIQADQLAITAAREQNDRHALREHAHRLKGTSGTVRAARLLQLSTRVEDAACEAAGDLDDRMFDELRAATQAFVTNARAVMAELLAAEDRAIS